MCVEEESDGSGGRICAGTVLLFDVVGIVAVSFAILSSDRCLMIPASEPHASDPQLPLM